MNLNWKEFFLGVAVAAGALFVYEMLSGQLATNTAIFNPDSYK